MKQDDFEGDNLAYRANLWRPWLETEATKEYFKAINGTIERVVRYLAESKCDNVEHSRGQLFALKLMVRMPRDAVRKQDDWDKLSPEERKKIAERKKGVNHAEKSGG